MPGVLRAGRALLALSGLAACGGGTPYDQRMAGIQAIQGKRVEQPWGSHALQGPFCPGAGDPEACRAACELAPPLIRDADPVLRACHGLALQLEATADHDAAAELHDRLCRKGVGPSCAAAARMCLARVGPCEGDRERALTYFMAACNEDSAEVCREGQTFYATGEFAPFSTATFLYGSCRGGDRAACLALTRLPDAAHFSSEVAESLQRACTLGHAPSCERIAARADSSEYWTRHNAEQAAKRPARSDRPRSNEPLGAVPPPPPTQEWYLYYVGTGGMLHENMLLTNPLRVPECYHVLAPPAWGPGQVQLHGLGIVLEKIGVRLAPEMVQVRHPMYFDGNSRLYWPREEAETRDCVRLDVRHLLEP